MSVARNCIPVGQQWRIQDLTLRGGGELCERGGGIENH